MSARLAAPAAGLALLLAGCASAPPPSGEAAPQAVACPKEVPAGIQCLGGRDSAGAHVLIALPADRSRWSGVLVLHAHGGPLLGEPRPERAVEDLQRWVVMVKAGHAWAGSTFRQGGVVVRAAAEDTERLRRIFVEHVAKPRRTVLHGQSWGASVAAKGAEMYTAGKPYDAVLLTSGVLGGGTKSYDFRLDLRVLYQHLCRNHPRADEPAYPLWMGLPADSKMTQADLALRARECLGLGLPAAQRTPEQAKKLKTIVDVIRIPERSVQGHLNWATFHFRDIAQNRSGGKPVFGNIGAVYGGTGDAALDREIDGAVPRYAADPAAVRAFGEDTDPNGHIPVPVLSLHAIHDPVAFVELQHEFRETMRRAGSEGRLVQAYTDHAEHSYLVDDLYVHAVQQLLAWVEQGVKPSSQGLAAACGANCRLAAGFEPLPLERRVAPRQRP